MPLSPPAAPGDFPDPFVVRVDDGWAAFATNAGGRNVQVRSSADLRVWEDRPDALPALGRWAVPGWTWSPAVTATPDGWVLWYVAREPRSGRQAISVATAARWDGPYVDRAPEPVLFQAEEGGSIDPSVFEDRDGSHYLLWKSDANALGRPSSLWGAPSTPGRPPWPARRSACSSTTGPGSAPSSRPRRCSPWPAGTGWPTPAGGGSRPATGWVWPWAPPPWARSPS